MKNLNLENLPTFFLQALLVTAAAVLSLVLITRYVAPIQLASTQTVAQRGAGFSTTGKATVTTTADKAEITLGISKKDTDIKKVQAQANQVMDSLTKKLADLGVSRERIQTQNYNVYPNYDYQKATQDIVGYSVDISVKVTVDVNPEDSSKIGQIVDAATAAGANQINGIQYILTPDKETQLRGQARQQAVDDAKKNAQDLAKLAGVQLGKIVNIQEGGDAQNNPLPMLDKMNAGAGGQGGAPTNVEPGSTTYNYTVTLTYETK
jgi:uncharacterized protein YggE